MTIKQLKEILLSDFWKFVKFMNIKRDNKVLIPNSKITSLYKDICDNLSKMKDTMILLPRRHLKTLIASLFVTWYIVKYPNKAVIIITDTRRKGIRLLKGIKSFFLQHTNFKNIFSDSMLAVKGNNEDTLTLSSRTTFAKEPNIAVYSIEQPIQSARADMILKEDIISDRFVKSNANREMVRYNLESLNAILEKDSLQIITGTRYTIDDPYNDIIKKDKNWYIIQHGVYDDVYDNSGVLCSYVMSYKEAKQIEEDHTPEFFAAQYLNNPRNSEVNIFDITSYERYKQYNYAEIEKIICGVDISDGIGKDKSAFVFVAKHHNQRYYILDCFSSNKIDTETLYYTFYNYYQKYQDKVISVIVELNRSGRNTLKDTFERLSKTNNHYIPFTGITNIEPKNIRIHRLEPLFRTSKLLLKDSSICSIYDNHLLNELRDFNYYDKNNSDDTIDAVSIAVTDLQRSERKNIINEYDRVYISKNKNSRKVFVK